MECMYNSPRQRKHPRLAHGPKACLLGPTWLNAASLVWSHQNSQHGRVISSAFGALFLFDWFWLCFDLEASSVCLHCFTGWGSSGSQVVLEIGEKIATG